MSTRVPTATAENGPTQWRAVTSEAIKLRSLRSHVWLLVSGALFLLALGPVQTLGSTLGPKSERPEDLDGLMSLALSGASTAMIIVGVLGILTVTSEYTRRTIRITLTALPRRQHVVLGKAASVTAASLALIVPTAAVAFEVSRRILARANTYVSWTDPGAIRVVVAVAWLLTGWAVLGQVVGWLVRSSVGAAFVLLALMFVVPALVQVIAGRAVAAWLPSEVGLAMLRIEPISDGIAPLPAAAAWTAYLALGLTFSVWLTKRRDH